MLQAQHGLQRDKERWNIQRFKHNLEEEECDFKKSEEELTKEEKKKVPPQPSRDSSAG